MALQFQRGVVRPAPGALDKTVVESGHGSWGIYTKSLFTAECAEIAEKAREMFFSCSLGDLCVLGGESVPSLVPYAGPEHPNMLG
jgi:hypothetical protein